MNAPSVVSVLIVVSMLVGGCGSVLPERVAGKGYKAQPATDASGKPLPLVIEEADAFWVTASFKESEERFAVSCRNRFGKTRAIFGKDNAHLRETREVKALEILYPRARYTLCQTNKGVVEFVWALDVNRWYLWDRDRLNSAIDYVEALSDPSRAALREANTKVADERRRVWEEEKGTYDRERRAQREAK